MFTLTRTAVRTLSVEGLPTGEIDPRYLQTAEERTDVLKSREAFGHHSFMLTYPSCSPCGGERSRGQERKGGERRGVEVIGEMRSERVEVGTESTAKGMSWPSRGIGLIFKCSFKSKSALLYFVSFLLTI